MHAGRVLAYLDKISRKALAFTCRKLVRARAGREFA
jgi:hypothetical protein